MKKSILLFIGCVLLLGGCQSEQVEELELSFHDIEYVEYGSEFDTQTLIKETNGVVQSYPILDTKQVGTQVLSFSILLEEQEELFEREIEVKDTNKPIIKLYKNKGIIEYNGKYKVSDYIKSISDKIDGDIKYKPINEVEDNETNYYTYQDNVKVDKAGKYKIIITAVDKNGNKSTQDIEITVNDKQVTTVKPTKAETSQPAEANQKDYNYVLTQTIEKTKIAKKVNKLVTFTSTSYGSKSGIAQYFVKEKGQWIEKMQTPAIFGSKGMGDGKENSKKSPIETYYFEKAYGIKSNPGSRLLYTRLNKNHYWCSEKFYNQFVDESVIDHSDCSKKQDEYLIEYNGYYNYIATFHYNSSHIPGKGSAYFMHTKQNAKSTMGCIAVAESQMIYLLKNIDTSTALIIDQVSKIKNH